MKYIVTFAGPIGSSKTPIAYYLSQKFSLPIYNNDAIRNEVIGDFLELDTEEFLKRRQERLAYLFRAGKSFILDASIDREWENYWKQLEKSDYKIFIISLDLSKNFINRIYHAKNYPGTPVETDKNFNDHQNFLEKYSSLVNFSINDTNFINRLTLSEQALIDWLKNNGS